MICAIGVRICPSSGIGVFGYGLEFRLAQRTDGHIGLRLMFLHLRRRFNQDEQSLRLRRIVDA